MGPLENKNLNGFLKEAKSGVCVVCPQEQSDRLLVMYPSTLIILSEENDGLFYKVTPLRS